MLLEIKDLKVEFHTDKGVTKAVKGVSFGMNDGEILGIVGESGSGKSTLGMTLMGLLPGTASYTGQVLFDGADMAKMSFEELRQYKGDEISVVFQEPMTSLNPLIRVGKQVEEMLTLHVNDTQDDGRLHEKLTKAQRKERVLEKGAELQKTLDRVLEMFRNVDLPEPEVTYRKYPHELSGGQQQRVMIAMALMCSPRLLIADEPTTALDADVQDQILDLLKEINRKQGTAIALVSHDLRVIQRICQNVLVMYKG